MGIMPWKTVDLMDQKLKFVHLAKSGRFTITELCEDFGISRKTGHKYLRRYQQDGASGLHERSRYPHRYANLTDKAVEKLILQDRRQHPTWGPKKPASRTLPPSSLFYAKGVKLQSPASRRAVRSFAKHGSARWVTNHRYGRTPTGFHK